MDCYSKCHWVEVNALVIVVSVELQKLLHCPFSKLMSIIHVSQAQK